MEADSEFTVPVSPCLYQSEASWKSKNDLKTNTIFFFTFQLKAILLRGKSLQKHKRKCANSDTSCLMTVS